MKRDVFPNRSPQQVSNRDDNLVQIDVAWPENLSPAECQKLPGQGGGSLGCFFDLADLLRQSGVQWPLQSKKSVAADDRQQIVEIVRYAPGQTSNHLHSLGFLQLAYHVRQLRQVQDREDKQAFSFDLDGFSGDQGIKRRAGGLEVDLHIPDRSMLAQGLQHLGPFFAR